MFKFYIPHCSTAERLLFGFVTMYSLICIGMAYDHGILARMDFLLYFSSGMAILVSCMSMFIIYLCLKILYWKATIKPSPLFGEWWPKLTKNFFDKQHLTHSIPLFILIIFFLTIFSNMKGLISYYGDYRWDPFFSELDQSIHFGKDPWRIMQPIFGYPFFTVAFDYLYSLWMILMFFILYWQLFSMANPRLRLQFFYTFVLNFSISGTLFAIIFASGGPCFYEAMVGNNYYIEQLNYLQEVNDQYMLGTVAIQKILLELYQQENIMIGVGISAMPSLHVATAFLFYLLTSQLNKWLGRLFALYCFLILLASVHLGFHYAIDGYFSVILTLIYWKVSGVIIEKAEQVDGIFPFFKQAFEKVFLRV